MARLSTWFSKPNHNLKRFIALRKLWNKLISMGYARHLNLSSDEMQGIKQAGDNGENPFAFSMICADTTKNGVFK